MVGAPNSGQCEHALRVSQEWCEHLGVPVASHKTDGPVTRLVFLGIELDTIQMSLHLPDCKLERLRKEIQRWSVRKTCTKRELLFLIGQLQHACCVVKLGRSFLRRMIELSRTAKELHHRIGASGLTCVGGPVGGMAPYVGGCGEECSQVVLMSDTSGSWGCGAFTSVGEWFQLELPSS